ncbi:MAG: hypothetical protein V1694_12095 [Candidatus Eisenbacteria bacterium]
MMRIGLVVTGIIFMLCGTVLGGDPVSPLYQARLAATLAEWEAGPRPVADVADDNGGPASLQPVSLCIGSACLGSVCIGSACLGSECLGSACLESSCLGSGCVGSACAGSTCVGTLCVGSACYGASACGSGCRRGGGQTNAVDPLPSTSLTRNCYQP